MRQASIIALRVEWKRIHISIMPSKSIFQLTVFSHGFCSCYVGKEGRCKHIVALLLKFKEGAADFDQSQSTLPLEASADKQDSIEQAGINAGDNMETAEDIVVVEAKPAENNDNPILLPPTPRKNKGRRQIPAQWSDPAPSKGANKRKRVEPATDGVAPEIQEASTSVNNDQQPSDSISSTSSVCLHIVHTIHICLIKNTNTTSSWFI